EALSATSIAGGFLVFLYEKNWLEAIIKKPSEVRELILARAKILVKKMKLLVLIEHCVLSLFSYGFLTPLAS
ncbi:hypothetical protein, partial [Streptococcus pseudopneumoniae]|uniref:hypothetical protein n=1 Tax=Streptococcus pseudopneumoniae TaxID=257758 RepID=UPI0019D690EE